jgi:hypothetical protein
MKNKIPINPDKLYTKSMYSKEFNVDRVTIDRRIKAEKLRTLKVKGTILIIVD